MDPDRQAAIIINDLDSLFHRIEMLPAHPQYTNAGSAVQQAKEQVELGRQDIHRQAMAKRHDV